MIQRQAFGRTGHASTRIIFGAAAFWRVTQAEADRTLELLQLQCCRQRIPVLPCIVYREHHHDVRQPIWFRLNNDGNSLESKLD